MRPISLLFGTQAADLPAATKGLVKLSQARASLGDVTARVGEFSFPMSLPPTQRNAGIFGSHKLHGLGLNKFGPYTDYACELRCEGQVLPAIFRLTSLKNGYTGSLIGAGISWALLLGDTMLTDLVFPTLEYDGSQLETILGQDNEATDLQFPLVAYGNFFAPPTTEILADGSTEEVPSPPAAVLDYPLSVDDYPPGVYYVNVLRQIFRSIGWQLQGRELDSAFWRAVVHTPAGANLDLAWPWGELLQCRATGAPTCFSYFDDAANNYSNSHGGFDQSSSGEVFYLPLAVPSVVLSPTRALDTAGASYTASREGTYRFAWNATLTGGHQKWLDLSFLTGTAFGNYFRPVGLGLVVRRGGQDYTGADGGLCTTPFTTTLVPGYTTGQDRVLTPDRIDVPGGSPLALRLGAYSGTTAEVYLAAGDTVELVCFARRRLLDDNGLVLLVRREFVATWANVSFACTSYTDNDGVSKKLMQPAAFLPPLKCADVVKDFLLRTDSFITTDAASQIATVLSRAELSTAGGEPLDLSARCDQRTVEYLPAAGADVGSLVFSPVALTDDPLVSETADIVTAGIGPGSTATAITSLYAVVGLRAVYLNNGLPQRLPTCSTKDILAQNRSETAWDIGSQAPRLVRYVGADATQLVPFMLRNVPLARAAFDGALLWDGIGGAVASYYADTLQRATHGHLARCQVLLTPSLYAQLTAGRRVYLFGAPYSVEVAQNFDPSDEASAAQLDLSRELF